MKNCLEEEKVIILWWTMNFLWITCIGESLKVNFDYIWKKKKKKSYYFTFLFSGFTLTWKKSQLASAVSFDFLPPSSRSLSLSAVRVLSPLLLQVGCLSQQMMWLRQQWPGHLFTSTYICVTLSLPPSLSLFHYSGEQLASREFCIQPLIVVFQHVS